LTMKPAWKSLQFSKTGNVFEILIWYCFLTYSSLSFLRFNLTTLNFCAACLFPVKLSLTSATTRLWLVPQLCPWKIIHRVYSTSNSYISIYNQSDCEFFPSGEVQV
jgi:hypothetical protein